MGRKVVSLDLGSSGVRAVQVSLGKKPTLTKAAFAPLPRGAVEAGEVKDPEAVATVLKALWAEHKFTTKQVVFGVANNNVLVRQMDLDWLEPAEFRKALRYQVADLVSVDIDEMTIDYHVLSEYEEPSTVEGEEPLRKVRILLVLAGNDMVTGFVDAITGAGLTPVQADLIPFALIRSAHPANSDPTVAEAVIEIGSDVTNVVIHQGGQPKFVRMVAGQGGNAITDALMARFGWGVDDAERTKIALGLGGQVAAPAGGDSVFGGMEAAPAPVQEHPAQAVINHVISAFISEVRTSLDFFLASSGDVKEFSRVVLCGGGSLLKGLQPRLSSELRLPVEYSTPLTGLTVDKKAGLPEELVEQQLSVAVGLALGVS